MVKFYENYFSYDYAWPAVTLAYFLRYPNPYSTHVLSTDTLSRHFDPLTGKLHTVRLHLKRGKLPGALTRFLPKIKESYILEQSVVDIKNQTMQTETRNLDWEGVISVIESQVYTPSSSDDVPTNTVTDKDKTDVKLTVKIESRVGHSRAISRETTPLISTSPSFPPPPSSSSPTAPASSGFLSSWTTGSLQKSIEILGMKRMREGLGTSKEGMKVVLEDLREKGLITAIQERRERKAAAASGAGERRSGGEQASGAVSRWAGVWRSAGTGVNVEDR